jgi:general secretion pathway protein D
MLTTSLPTTAAFAQEQPAGNKAAPGKAATDRTIPVKTGTGTLNTKGKAKDLKARGSGVLRRNGGKQTLDPDYDPAQTSKKLGADRGADGDRPVVPTPAGGRDKGGDKAGSAPIGDDDLKKMGDDVVAIKNNFSDIKCKRLPANAKVTLDFQDAPIEAVMKLVSCWTNRNFILATQKRGGKITILSPQPVSVYEAYRAFLSSLMVNGMSVTKKGSFYHIVDTADARSSGAEVVGPKGAVPNDDNVVTRIIRLKNLDAKEVEPLVTKFKSKAGDLFVYAPTNSVIVTDTGTNIHRIIKLLADVDLPLGAEKIWLRPVQHMDASELVEKITAVFEGAGKGAPAPGAAGAAAQGGPAGNKVTMSKAIADDRSNQLILIATRSNYLKIDALIRKLDVPIPGEGAIHIHHLENADAEDVASTLSSLAGGGGGSKPAARGKSGGGAKGGGAKGGGGAATLFEGDVKITAHKATNSLVIESSLKDYLALQKVVAELDRRRKQVYVEAVIMEISTSKNRKTQLAGSAGTTFDIGGNTVPLLVGLGGLGMGGVSLSQLNAGGFAAGLQGPLLNVNAGNTGTSTSAAGVTLSIPAFGFLIQAIQENSDVNVLSTPSILTLNNEDAEITIGRKIPYRSQSLGGGGLGGLGGLAGSIPGASSALGGLGGLGGLLGGALGGTVQHLDVDLTLKITPQINESDFIKLKIDQQLDEVEGISPDLGPTTSKRKISNTVVVRDQQPVIIGGLITDRETTGVSKIPILGDLPLLGIFFRKNTTLIEKKNLMLIIVPHIIKDPSDLERIHENKMEQIRQFADELATKQKEYQGKVDYRKKRGFLESVFQTVEKASEERKLQEKAYFDNADVDLVGPPERHDLDFDPFKAQKDKEAQDKKLQDKKAGKEGDEGKADEGDDEPSVEVIDLPESDKAGAGKAGKGEAKDADKADLDDGDKPGRESKPAPVTSKPGKGAKVKAKPAAKGKGTTTKAGKAAKAAKPVGTEKASEKPATSPEPKP